MSIVRIQPADAATLEAEYATVEAVVRDAVTGLSPLITAGLALLDQPGQHPMYGPMPALNAVGSGLSDDRLDLAWRLDWIQTSDAAPLGITGQVSAFTPGSLDDILTNAGLSPLQIARARNAIRNGADLQDAIDNEHHRERDAAWAAFRRGEAQAWTAAPERTPIENAQYSLDEIRELLDTAKQDRGNGIGTADADNIWSTNDLKAMVDNEHGYYTAEQVEHARTVLAMAESSPEAREHLGITESGGGWTFSDIGHLTLDIVGMVPVVGNAADGINAAWYAAEGDYLNAALSSLALIPAVGQAVTIAKPAIAAASAGIIFKNLDEALIWARNWLEARGILKAGDEGLEAAQSTVYRVQGGTPPRASHERIRISPDGDMIIDGDARLYVTFDDLGRAQAYIANNRPGAQIVAFDIDPAFVDRVRSSAVPQGRGPEFPDLPQIADPSKTDSSFGIPSSWFSDMVDASVTGSGRIVE